MNNFRYWIKENKLANFTLLFFTLFMIGIGFLYKSFFETNKKPVYGTRLQCKKTSEFTKGDKDEISKTLKIKEVESHEIKLQGCKLNILIKLNKDIKKETPKVIFKNIDKTLDEGQKKAYDIQVFFYQEENSKDFPMIAYRHHGESATSWT